MTDLSSILEEQDELRRASALLDWLDRLAPGDFPAALLELEQSPQAPLRQKERSLMIQAWAETDVTGAAVWLKENAKRGDLQNLTYIWAMHDPQAALAWAKAFDDGKGSIESLETEEGAFRGIAATDPDLGKSYLAGLDEDGLVFPAAGIEPELLSRGFDFAADWIDSLPDGEVRNTLAAHYSEKLAEMDPRRAAEWSLSTQGGPIWENVARIWGAVEPGSAREWTAALPPGAGRDDAIREVTEQASKLDLAGTGEWLKSLSGGEELDPARECYIGALAEQDPQAALAFVPLLTGDDSRSRYLTQIAENWAESDPTAAKAWVDAHAAELPADLVEKVRSAPATPASGE